MNETTATIEKMKDLDKNFDASEYDTIPNDLFESILSHPQAKYTPEERIRAAAYFVVLGSSLKTSRYTGIPAPTIRYWINRTKWWGELVKHIRKQKQEELDALLTEIITKGSAELLDRVENGDVKVNQTTGDEYRVKMDSNSLAKNALGIPYDKRALLRGDPTSRIERQVNQNELLTDLAKTFEKFTKQVMMANNKSKVVTEVKPEEV